MAKKPAKKAAKKHKSKARKVAAKKRPAVKRTRTIEKPEIKLQVDGSVPPVAERLNRDEKNALRKQLQANLKTEKDPVKRKALRREAATQLKY